jgi:hypothetical protein
MIKFKIQKNIKTLIGNGFENKSKGFTLLFAVLAATLVLSVGAAIISVAVRQVLLSGAGRESQYAFYAANTGIECALYWDLQASSTNPESYVFATSSDTTINSGYGADCVGINISEKIASGDPINNNDDFGISASDPSSATTIFRLDFTNTDGSGYFDETDGKPTPNYCSDVVVRKWLDYDDDLGFNRIFTSIYAQGYNTCDPNSTRRISRGLDLHY